MIISSLTPLGYVIVGVVLGIAPIVACCWPRRKTR